MIFIPFEISPGLLYRCLQSDIELGFPDSPYPLTYDLACSVEQEDVGLVPVAQLLFERFRIWVVDVEVSKINLSSILCFQPVHDGRQRLAGRSPKGEELKQYRFSQSQDNCRRVGGA